jgi:hypothetical protein
MNLEGTDIVRLTTGEGEASNPSWHPDGQHIAFAWTRGFEPGNFNIFVMDVATRQYVQLTHGMGRNENRHGGRMANTWCFRRVKAAVLSFTPCSLTALKSGN